MSARSERRSIEQRSLKLCPKETPFRWKEKLPWEKIKTVQTVCQEAMKLWGYSIAKNENDLKVLFPLLPLNL